jgi:branched-chain amino acid transport system permease protein
VEVAINYVNQFLALGIFAITLNLLIGYGGIFSAAQAGFGAVGGYTFAYLIVNHGLSFWPAAIAAIVITAVVSLLVALPALRLEALWLVLLTLAVQIVISNIPNNVPALGGPNGILVNQSFNIFGFSLSLPTQVFPVLLIALILVFAVSWRIGESPYGRVLRGIRDDQVAARSLGRNVYQYKLALFVITGIAAGLGGVMLTLQTDIASPSLYSFNVSIEMIAMVIIGGMGNLWGSLLGCAIIVGSTPFFLYVVNLGNNVSGLAQNVAYGIALVLIVLFRPRGILPEGVSPGTAMRWLRRRAQVPARPVFAVGGSAELAVAAQDDNLATELENIEVPARLPAQSTDIPLEPPRIVHRIPPALRGEAEGARHVNGQQDVAGVRAADGTPEVVLEVRDLTKSFGGIRAVNGMSMDLRRGLVTALVGPNGAGKTTVFNLITGSIRPDLGIVRLNGVDITGKRPDEVAHLGMVRTFQDVRIFPELTVIDNVVLGIQDHPGEKLTNLFLRPAASRRFNDAARAKAADWLDLVGLLPLSGTRASSLGFGQQKLLAIARVLATEAEVLLLDEPASAIDISWVDTVLDFIDLLKEAGRTICLVEHSLHVVERLADRVYFMELGAVTAEGSLAELTSDERLAQAYFGTV